MSAVDSAVRAAVAAAPAARRASDAERAGWLVAVADALDAASAELVALADAETHLGSPRLPGEVARTTAQLRLFASVVQEGSYLEAVVDHADATTTPPRPDLRRVLVPLGPVAVYAASNFPFAFSVAGGDTASALAVGCPVVVKAHPGHPRTSLRTAAIVTEALAAAGAPTGLFGMVEGYQEGIDLVEHPGITAAAFTGSVRGGRALADRAAARPAPIPFFGELGSANPVVVTAAADAARGGELAAGLAGSFTLGAGQFCTKPGIVFVPEGSALERALPSAVTAPAATMLTGSIADGFVQGSTALAGVEGVQTLLASSGAGSPGVYAVDSAVFVEQHDVLGAEVFGPATLLVRYGERDDLLAALDGLEGSLTATLHSEADDDVDDVLAALVDRSGRVLFAGWPTGVAVSWAQQHGGPWPATTSQHTSVGATAVRRFQRPVAFQDAPERLLPLALREGNPLGVPRRVDGVFIA
ncbi:aldehyde dehydrogenase family protein [Rathayibacter sp. Leaf296]|uniref:aldehyde dehydrogenase family protein n=1 Tax=Rathayibacter sp. Leaf296 TaxID=1736327 RepID=UPI0007024F61|nr:aldehyde dehydrogenase family protein [Rathayibacter sp. Leaf296]KQQ08550.1 aldehyde dehydrogenase [Rathayibacter sp. Leaf296]